MKSEPKLGQLVYLNSGSPPMTISEIHDSDEATVSWVTPAAELHEAIFPLDCLTEIINEDT